MLLLASCALREQLEREKDLDQKLALGQQFRDEGKYDQALQVYKGLAAAYPQTPPGDLALREAAFLLVHPGRPQKKYREAQDLWWKLLKNFPQSPYTAEARTWISLLTAHLDLQTQLEKEKQQLLQVKGQQEDCKAHLEELKQDQKNLAFDLIARNQKLMAQRDFDKILEENASVLSKNGAKPPADEALYALGLVYAYGEYPKKDALKALGFFNRLVREFPRSWRAEEAKVWIKNIETFEKSKQIDLEIEDKRKQLRK
ncbi:MAG: tetratricopeptide repeat protein [Desulfobacterota bacterium]|jgi:TolA-binding protein|nr:tetratricopeptide repeat protein [Thermodesulfobacteriota bacterium]